MRVIRDKNDRMMKLSDNVFNARQVRSAPKLKLWRYAGLMLTYRCNAACAFCYYYCGPQAGGLLPVETAMDAWAALRRLAGDSARVHLTGGEPFLYFDRLLEICEQAQRRNLGGVDFVETNGGWVADETSVRRRLRALNAAGVRRLKISWDLFHAEFVPVEKVRLLVRLAGEQFGPDGVLVRWQHRLDNPLEAVAMDEAGRLDAMRAEMNEHGGRFTGRAAQRLGPLCATIPPQELAGRHCRRAILGAKGVHIDPYGNVFSGQCSGMTVGNLAEAGLDGLWKTFDPHLSDFWGRLYARGPSGLLDSAVAAGYEPRTAYASKCHLCADIRRFYFDTGRFLSIIGPDACYGKMSL